MQEHSPERVSRAGASESKLIGLLSSLPRVKPLRAVLRTGYPGTAPCLVLPEVAPLAANGSGEPEFKGLTKKTAKLSARGLKSITGIAILFYFIPPWMALGSLFVVKKSGNQKITNEHIFLRISSKTLEP